MKIIRTSPETKRRHLKVYSRMWPKGRGFQQLPEIRLMGKWLERSGFKSGQDISVYLMQHKLVITSRARKTIVL